MLRLQTRAVMEDGHEMTLKLQNVRHERKFEIGTVNIQVIRESQGQEFELRSSRRETCYT